MGWFITGLSVVEVWFVLVENACGASPWVHHGFTFLLSVFNRPRGAVVQHRADHFEGRGFDSRREHQGLFVF